VTRCVPEHVAAVCAKMAQAGIEVSQPDAHSVRVRGGGRIRSVDMTTEEYPGFATDLQAQYMALMCLARGNCVISETIFKDRFTHVPELRRLGADIKIEGNTALVGRVKGLSGAHVMATDLRASAALVLAGLVAEGETHVSRVYHIDRGYEAIEKKLAGLGASVQRVRA
jgi:UDP-N-acetylglucosamine 1-carboxyvinyltransferase